jgi:DNA-binding transcriptional regulator YiaG
MKQQFRQFYDIQLGFMELDQRQIAKLRKKLGWSQSAMARAFGIANAVTISHWETGVSTPASTAMRLLCLLDSLSEQEMRKIALRLEQISQGTIKAND